ncbi:MAG: hypothetical protein ACRCYO_02110 [Bacteroidia bacterium]
MKKLILLSLFLLTVCSSKLMAQSITNSLPTGLFMYVNYAAAGKFKSPTFDAYVASYNGTITNNKPSFGLTAGFGIVHSNRIIVELDYSSSSNIKTVTLGSGPATLEADYKFQQQAVNFGLGVSFTRIERGSPLVIYPTFGGFFGKYAIRTGESFENKYSNWPTALEAGLGLIVGGNTLRFSAKAQYVFSAIKYISLEDKEHESTNPNQFYNNLYYANGQDYVQTDFKYMRFSFGLHFYFGEFTY